MSANPQFVVHRDVGSLRPRAHGRLVRFLTLLISLLALVLLQGADRFPVYADGVAAAAIAAGGDHTCALTTSGGVRCWGRNFRGQLGDGTTTDRVSPVDVVGLTSGVVAIAAGGHHTCALTAGGGVKCWGWNINGQLGNGMTSSAARTTPVDVAGLGGVRAITAGEFHTCALTMDGGVKCWGANFRGQLGDGTTTQRTTPVSVFGPLGGVTAIAADRGDHTCAVVQGIVVGAKCWGTNGNGQLGDGSITTLRTTPTDVFDLEDVQALALGSNYSCALTSGGGVKCWGGNSSGQLGDGTTILRSTPVAVLNAGGTSVAAGLAHTCAGGGAAKCWGDNSSGQLGDDTTTNRLTAVDVSGLTGVISIVAGNRHTCALVAGGGVKCWGGNGSGQLGDGTTTQRRVPVDVFGLTGAPPQTRQSAVMSVCSPGAPE